MSDKEREAGLPPKFPAYPVNETQKAERDALERRMASDKAHYERGFPVAGHDFAQEALERDDPERER